MNPGKTIDYFIVGQGIAGSCLAQELLRRGHKIMVFDTPERNRSTAVAAGLINPVTGKLMKTSWNADVLFPACHEFYKKAEEEMRQQFFFPQPVYRPFISIEEQNEWMGRSTSDSMRKYIEAIFYESKFGDDVNDTFGGVLLKGGGYVNTSLFTEAVRMLLINRDAYSEQHVDDKSFLDEGGGISLGDLKARAIVYCRGVHELEGGCFRWVPIKPLKGEVLTIEMREVARIYNRGVYVVPASQPGYYSVGATYDPNGEPGVSEHAREELLVKLNQLIRQPFKVIDQAWGIRPTTPDRKPLLGRHPDMPNRVIFNGLGTKGVSLAPFLSQVIAGFLNGEIEIPSEVNIGRYKSLYSKFE